MYGSQWGSLAAARMQFIKSRIFYYESRENPYQYELSRSAFQSSNPIGQFIIHIYIHIRAVALTTPLIPTLITPNPINQIRALKRTSVL